jgi:hypothetical protein
MDQGAPLAKAATRAPVTRRLDTTAHRDTQAADRPRGSAPGVGRWSAAACYGSLLAADGVASASRRSTAAAVSCCVATDAHVHYRLHSPPLVAALASFYAGGRGHHWKVATEEQRMKQHM